MLRRLPIWACLTVLVFGCVPAAFAQSSKIDFVEVKKIDESIFSKRNKKHLCKEGAQRIVDRDILQTKLKALADLEGYELEDVEAAFIAWFNDTRSNKQYLPDNGTPPRRVSYREFLTNPNYRIICTVAPGDGGQEGAGDPVTKLAKKIIVRQAVSDIKAKTDDIGKVNAATLSFAQDDVAHTTTFAAEGLVGISFTGSSAEKGYLSTILPGPYWYSVTPYIYHKRFDLEPDSKTKKDVNYAMPGIASNLVLVSADLRTSLAVQFDANTIIDEQQDSLQSTGALRLSPSFTVGEQRFLRAPLPIWGNLALYPELTAVAREFVIHDQGSNKDLLGKSSFSSLGFDATTQLYWTDANSVLSTFVLKAGYVFRENSGAVPDIRRTTAGLVFSPAANKNITVELQYVSGRDENTLQLEERWSAALGIRY